MSHLRFKEVELAFNREPVTVDIPKEAPSEYYGMYVFNRKAMFKYLPKKTFDALTYAIDNKKPLDITVADSVAAGLQKWAMEKGCTHYTHTGFTHSPTAQPKSTTHSLNTTVNQE